MSKGRKAPMLRGLFVDVAMPKAKREPGAERDIQKACIDWLNTLPGVAVWRQNVGSGFFSNKTGPQRFVRFGQKGEGDIRGIGPRGITISIEVKVPGRDLTDDQMLWIDMILRHGGIAFGVNSLESCVSQFREAFVKRNWFWDRNWNIA